MYVMSGWKLEYDPYRSGFDNNFIVIDLSNLEDHKSKNLPLKWKLVTPTQGEPFLGQQQSFEFHNGCNKLKIYTFFNF